MPKQKGPEPGTFIGHSDVDWIAMASLLHDKIRLTEDVASQVDEALVKSERNRPDMLHCSCNSNEFMLVCQESRDANTFEQIVPNVALICRNCYGLVDLEEVLELSTSTCA